MDELQKQGCQRDAVRHGDIGAEGCIKPPGRQERPLPFLLQVIDLANDMLEEIITAILDGGRDVSLYQG
ncbi:hypothetical protein GRO01_08340 [Gluconobacter roseus NBRC 3990]|uniref:Uncharacterized protein n=1 Tax=Gluconobacter roseus NBRC 3990 TaxID=1307950 RepID=A0A4Y3M724_9PROT|nr:hypothetical protein AA3990_2146 [Gluconobacter roseus NBRC 3990]GEB03258.1 hypothetical protein GRO01_08340 [Gluconobacter roseus NBRC 3990]GLP93716.1 hypothetical protein GCM10007871_16940 [Gluconobacter roseus NBRC 3990]